MAIVEAVRLRSPGRLAVLRLSEFLLITGGAAAAIAEFGVVFIPRKEPKADRDLS